MEAKLKAAEELLEGFKGKIENKNKILTELAKKALETAPEAIKAKYAQSTEEPETIMELVAKEAKEFEENEKKGKEEKQKVLNDYKAQLAKKLNIPTNSPLLDYTPGQAGNQEEKKTEKKSEKKDEVENSKFVSLGELSKMTFAEMRKKVDELRGKTKPEN
ncbi:hypothetical protein KJ612_19305 [Myxococcota bacterium]|nr:hypothetical protein [Myxococcota bacterium]